MIKRNGELTTLQPGMMLCWDEISMSFQIQGPPGMILHWEGGGGGDDKAMIGSISHNQAHNILLLVSQVTGLDYEYRKSPKGEPMAIFKKGPLCSPTS